jgi:hypothetical protein
MIRVLVERYGVQAMAESRDNSLFRNDYTGWCPLKLHIHWLGAAILPAVKQTRGETDNLPAHTDKDKKSGYTRVLLLRCVCPFDLRRDKFSF